MSIRTGNLTALFVALTVMLLSHAAFPLATSAQDIVITKENRSKIEAVIRDYLLSNPEILAEAQQALEEKQAREQREKQKQIISALGDSLFDSGHDGIIGNKDGSVTIVEFFDYNCGYCKRALGDMLTMVEADPDLKFVLKELPILGEDSKRAHIVSQALIYVAPEHYPEFHKRLLGSPGRANEQKAFDIAIDLGVDEAKLREAMDNPETLKIFNTTIELANQLSISGTPSYVVGDEVVFGALGNEILQAKVENLRKCQSTSC